ncbi:YadA-like family protein, partial [Sphingomonas sp.]|uniref:YadA family autotransporter adhesin n=1 Tax=Sphingomonas sp. TaxID=28214 RepID=UPI0031D23DE6
DVATLTASGGTAANPGNAQKLTNLAAGTVSASSTDAVNGSQLYATNQQVAQNESNISNLSNAISSGSIGLVQQTGGMPGSGQITIGSMTGGTSINVAGTSGDRTISGVAAGVAKDDAVNVGQLAAAIASASANAVQYDDSSRTSVTFNPGGAATGLHNVASGAVSSASTDAVNGSQLFATNQQVASNTVQISSLVNGQAGPFRSNNSSGLAAPLAAGDDAIAGGYGAVASGLRSTAIGAGSSATGSNSVALGYGSTDGGLSNVVSVGGVGTERQITNVAAGTRATDAVNVGQLNTGLASTLLQANNYTDGRVNALAFDLGRVRRDANTGTAIAMASAGLPQAYEAGKGMIAGALGVYQDQTALAVGFSKAFVDGHTVVKGSASFSTQAGLVGGNVGIGYQF